MNLKTQKSDCVKLHCGRILLILPAGFPTFGECDVSHHADTSMQLRSDRIAKCF